MVFRLTTCCRHFNFWGRRPKRRQLRSRLNLYTILIFLGSICCLVVVGLFSFYFSHLSSIIGESDDSIEIDLSQNYFQTREFLESRGFIVDTPKCKIPDVDIWDEGVRRLAKPPRNYNCAKRSAKLTYVEKDTVVISEDALNAMGYTLDEISCCYKTIKRVDQTRESFDRDADNLFSISDDCILLEKVTKPKSPFIKVTCKVKGLIHGLFNTYTNFHMIATFPDDDSKGNISRKLNWWRDCLSGKEHVDDRSVCSSFREKGRPPNILLFGWDSTSRGNFHRFMPKTKQVLENVIGAVEMVGYNKVGENTLPNFVPLTTSLSLQELKKICYFNDSYPLDDCPFIWKRFNDLNYLTGHMEDAPGISAFNYLKTGFVTPPLDIHPRSLMLAAYGNDGAFTGCIGYQRPEEMILNYMADLAELSESRGIPYMLSTWLTDLTHHDMNNLQTADEHMASILKRLKDNRLLDNTLLILMSDHGYRFLSVRTTVSGWFEDRLPTLWIKLPPSLTKEKESWEQALRQNSKNLVTAFDIYEIFPDLIKLYWPSVSKLVRDGIPAINNTRGLTLFQKIPDRSCDEAGVPPEYCACTAPTASQFNASFLKLAAEMVVKTINSELFGGCATLKVASITASGALEKTGSRNTGREDPATEMDVIIALKTKPGNFLFEAILNYDKTRGNFTRVSRYMRMNQQVTSVVCLPIPENGWLELLCYCDTITNKIASEFNLQV